MLREGQVSMVQIKPEKTYIELCLVARYQHRHREVQTYNSYQQVQTSPKSPLLYQKYGHSSPRLEYTWTSITTTQTVKVLHDIFTRHGIPEQLVSDNRP